MSGVIGVRGWCPGALRPMRSGDELIVRLRISGGIVDQALAAAIAQWSLRWGNGEIDLTSRGNLQLRGISERNLPGLYDALAEWDLLDATAAAEAVRNIVVSPLAGLDPAAVLDIRPVVRALERRLAADETLHALPGKFSFAIDDGGHFGLDDVAADIRFVACPGEQGPEFAIGLAGANDPIGRCPPDELPETAAALCHSFLLARRGREHQIRRMRDLVKLSGPEAGTGTNCLGVDLSCHAASKAVSSPMRDGTGKTGATPSLNTFPVPRCLPGDACLPACDTEHDGSRDPLGVDRGPDRRSSPIMILGLDPRLGPDARSPTTSRIDTITSRNDSAAFPTRTILGIGLPFGRVVAEDLAALTAAATAMGTRQLRLTPWRAILVPVASGETARAICADLPPNAFILNAGDPRRRIAACPGSPACEQATTNVRDDAATLAPMLAAARRNGILLHISGCAKGCAHPRAAAVTLVGQHGRYDLVRDGKASDIPDLRGLTPARAAIEVSAIIVKLAGERKAHQLEGPAA
jgi:precorrin-3B synthase